MPCQMNHFYIMAQDLQKPAKLFPPMIQDEARIYSGTLVLN